MPSKPLFQTVSDTPESYPKIATREEVYSVLALYSDWLNWNTHPEVEQRLREVLCEIYGHAPYSGLTWKPAGYCYWCKQKTEP